VPHIQLAAQVAEMLQTIQASLYDKALAFRKNNTHRPEDYAELTKIVETGFAYAWWCGSPECEQKVKDDTKATTRCIPLDQPDDAGNCIVCGQPARQKVYFARAY
jgi:prolyl-tRNA synthetase